MDFIQLTQYALEHRASDIHLQSGLQPMLRIDGGMTEINIGKIDKEQMLKLLHSIMTDAQKKTYEEEKDIDFSIAPTADSRFRVNAFYTIDGPAAVLRSIPTKVRTLSDLQTPPAIEFFTRLPKGLVLVTGPTGSGKSTTLAAMIDYINQNFDKHVITIEDPIEFVHKSKKSLIAQREVGADTKSFSRALKSALREDPDVILVGEMRDIETISLALTAAETGHLVFGTLHTSSAAQTINRIIDIFPGEDKPMIRTMLSTSLEGVVAQRLIKRSKGVGRVAAYEIMIANGAIRNLVRENKVPQITSMIQIGVKDGMILMKDYVQDLIAKGIVTEQDAAEVLRSSDDSSKSLGSAISNNATVIQSNEHNLIPIMGNVPQKKDDEF